MVTNKLKPVVNQNPTHPTNAVVSANRALMLRYKDLPRSEQEKMKTELEAIGLWWHFRSYLVFEGTNLGGVKAKAIPILSWYLGVSLQEFASNKLDYQPYEVFAAKRTLTNKA